MANDPNTIQYVIQEDGFWYVASKEKNPYVPELTVSAKGIANGLSTEYNDGWDFGPDSYDPSSTASIPYTQTSGIQEAGIYSDANAIPIRLMDGVFELTAQITLSVNYLNMVGKGKNSSIIKLIGDVGFLTQSANNTSQPVYAEIRNIGFDQYNSTGNTFGVQLNAAPISSSVNGGEATIDGCSFYTTGTHNFGTVLIQGDQPTNIGFNPIRFTNNEILRDPTLPSAGGDFLDIYGSPNILATGNIFKDPQNNPCIVVAGQVPVENVIISDNVGRITNSNGNNSNLVSIYPVNNNSQVYHNVLVIGNTLYTADKATYNWETLVIADGSNTSYTIPNNATIEHLMMVGNSNNGSYNNNIYDNYQTAITLSQVITNGYNGAFTPTISTNPPVSGTAYQNTNPYDIEIDLPVYATTAGTAGYVTIAKGSSSSSLTTIGNQFVNGSTSSTSVDIIRLRVPAGWYYEFTSSGVTFGTASVFAD